MPESEDEELEPPATSPEDVKESIKIKFLVEMPDDFYLFWDFCKSKDASKPQGNTYVYKKAMYIVQVQEFFIRIFYFFTMAISFSCLWFCGLLSF